MIYFLQHSSEGKRGGEVYLCRLFNFIKRHFQDVHPGNLEQLLPDLRNPIRHMFFRKIMVEQYQIDLVTVDISSIIRNFLAAYSIKKIKYTTTQIAESVKDVIIERRK